MPETGETLRVALVTDAHYARGRRVGSRRCDLSLDKLRAIFRVLPPVDALIDLGDRVNATGDAAEDAANIAEAGALMRSFPAPCFHVLGNHDCEAAKKAVFLPRTAPGGGFSFDLKGVRFFALDANFISTGESYDDAAWDWTDAWIPERQLQWLRDGLRDAPGPAVVLCHQNLDDRGDDPHLVGNAAAVRAVLEESGRVICVLQGHCHDGCYSECGGIPYYTFRALCEGERAPYALLEVRGGVPRVTENILAFSG